MQQKVYVIQHELGPVKIGLAEQPRARLGDIQISCPFDLKLRQTASPDNPLEVERYLHRYFDQYHLRGEWFDIPENELDFGIPSNVDDRGEADIRITDRNRRYTDEEWAKTFHRLFEALSGTRSRTVLASSIYSQVKAARDVRWGDGSETTVPPETSEDVDVGDFQKGMEHCRRCGHLHERRDHTCPTCGAAV